MSIKKFIQPVIMLAAFVFVYLPVSAQSVKVPAPSPFQTIKQSFGLGDINVEYSRPSIKGRIVFGDLVPYGKVWRTGAISSTIITFSDDVKLEGNTVAAGTYALYTIPNRDSWEVMLYKDTKLAGNVADYKNENEVLRFKARPTVLSNKVETFTIQLSDVTANAAVLELLWDRTRVPINITTDIDSKIMKSIESAMSADNRPYFQAASYYYDNNKDLSQALAWADKAVAQNPKAFWVHMLKARIEYKMNNKTAATTSAAKVITLAKEAKNDDYVKMAEQLIVDANKK